MKKFGVAIIGCGGIHGVHAEAIGKSEHGELSMVCDIDSARAEAFGKKYDVPWTSDYRAVLSSEAVQSVHLCTPHYLHRDMAMAAIAAGKMVLVEKPLAIRLSEAEELVRAQNRTGARVGVCFQNRYRFIMRTMYRLLREGGVGAVRGARSFVTWQRDDAYYLGEPWRGTWNQEGGGILINQVIHTLDLIQWLMGGIADVRGTVSHHTFGHIIETEDTAELKMTTYNGATVLFYGTTGYSANSPVFLEIETENALLRAEDDLLITWKDGRVERFDEETATGPKAYWGIHHQTLIEDFYRCAAEGLPFSIDAAEGLKTVAIFDKVYRSPVMNRCR